MQLRYYVWHPAVSQIVYSIIIIIIIIIIEVKPRASTGFPFNTHITAPNRLEVLDPHKCHLQWVVPCLCTRLMRRGSLGSSAWETGGESSVTPLPPAASLIVIPTGVGARSSRPACQQQCSLPVMKSFPEWEIQQKHEAIPVFIVADIFHRLSKIFGRHGDTNIWGHFPKESDMYLGSGWLQLNRWWLCGSRSEFVNPSTCQFPCAFIHTPCQSFRAGRLGWLVYELS